MAPPSDFASSTAERSSSRERTVGRMDELIGETPLLQLDEAGPGAAVYVKREDVNPTGSVRDRYLDEIIGRAFDAGHLVAGDTVGVAGIDDSSVAAAFLGGRLGLHTRVFAPEGAGRRLLPLLERYGAEVEWLEGVSDWSDAVDYAVEWARRRPDRMFVDGFRREAVEDGYRRVADEIVGAVGERPLAAFVTSVTTGGAYRHVTERLRDAYPDLAVGGAVLADGELPDLERREDDVLCDVSLDEAWTMRDELAAGTGLLLGPKGAAAVSIARDMASEFEADRAVVALNPDAGQRYLGWEDEKLTEFDRRR